MIYDYLIIGSGFGGSVSTLRLAEKGYKVLTLEQGKRYHSEDFPKSNWNLPRYLWFPPLRFFGFQKLSFYKTASIMSGTGVGGGSLVYANTLYYPPAKFFKDEAWASFGDWEQKLNIFYKKAGFMLGREKYNRQNREDLVLKEVAEEMNAGETFDTVQVAVNLEKGKEGTDPYFGGMGPFRKSCTECGGVWLAAGKMQKIPWTKTTSGSPKKWGRKSWRKQKLKKSPMQMGCTTLKHSV